jgi:hypothetical protein
MFDLDGEIRRWRERQERDTSLSPRELDELEDHLRAWTRLELEVNAALTPPRAFALARQALGGADAVSREFAKAGKPRWRKLLLAGWALFGASFLLPAFYVPEAGLGLARPLGIEPYYGYEVFWKLLVADGELGNVLAALTPFVAMLLTLIPLRGKPGTRRRWLRYALSVVGAGGVALGFMVPPVAVSQAGAAAFMQHLGIGFWAWSLSFVCAAAALWIRDHDGASAAIVPDIGALQ